MVELFQLILKITELFLPLGIFLLFAVTGWFLDDAWLSGKGRARLWLQMIGTAKGFDRTLRVSLPIRIFQSYFGEKPWSWKCLRRSALMTTIVIISFFLIRLLEVSENYTAGEYPSGFLGHMAIQIFKLIDGSTNWLILLNENFAIFIFFTVTIFFTNIFIDYISVTETYYFMYKTVRCRRRVSFMVIFLVADFIFTMTIIFILFNASMFLMVLLMNDFSAAIGQLTSGVFAGIILEMANIISDDGLSITPFSEGWIFIYSTFITSVWLWMIYVTGALILLKNIAYYVATIGITYSKMKGRPLRLFGFVSGAISSLLFALSMVVEWVFFS